MKKYFLLSLSFLFLVACKKGTTLTTCWVHGQVIDNVTGLAVPNFTVQVDKLLPTGYSQKMASPSTDMNGNYSVVLNIGNNLNASDNIDIHYAGTGLYNFVKGSGIRSQVLPEVKFNFVYNCLSQYTMFFKSNTQIADSIIYYLTNQYQPSAITTIIPNQNNIAFGFIVMVAGTKNYLYYTTYKAGVKTNYVDSIIPICQPTTIDTVKYN